MAPLQSTDLTTASSINTTKILSNATATHIQSQLHHAKKIKINKFADLTILTATTKNDAEEDTHADISNSTQVLNYIDI